MSPVSAFPAQTREPAPTPVPVIEIQKQTLLDYLTAFGLASQLTEAEKLQFIEVAQAFNLNPFRREIYCVVYGEGEYRKMSIVVGYEVYLKRAERLGKLNGWRVWIEGEGEQMKALVEIHRKDWEQPFIHESYWKEACQKKKDGSLSSLWSKQPRFMLKKVATSQAFRLCFPDELGGLPYDPAELPEGESITPTVLIPKATINQAESIQSSPPAEQPRDTEPIRLGIHIDPIVTSETSTALAHPEGQSNFRDPYPDEGQEDLFARLLAYLDDNAGAFTDKHTAWVIDKARKSRDREGILKMLRYSEKVVRNVNTTAGIPA